MINEWTVTYAIACILAGVGIARARGQQRPVWRHVVGWLIASAIFALVIWSVLGCTVLPLLDVENFVGLANWAGCVIGAGFWASAVVLAALPLYALLLSFYVLRFGSERDAWPGVVRRATILSAPVGLALLYGYLFPVLGDVGPAIREALPPAALGFLSCLGGLVLSRIVISGLGLGSLVAKDAA